MTVLVSALVHDPEVVRSNAGRIVGNPPYRAGDPGIIRRTLQQLVDTVGAFLGEVLGTIGGTPPLAWAIAAVGLVLLAVVVWRATRGATLGRGGDPLVPVRGSVRSAASWGAEAELHLASGRLEEALRARYAAAVVTLLERGLLDDVPGRTIRELDGELSVAAPSIAAAVAAAGARVEHVVFGDEPATHRDLEVAADALEAASRAIGRVEVGAGV